MERRWMMFRKSAMLCACMLLTAMFGGCSNTGNPAESQVQPTTETAIVSQNICYVSGNDTVDAAKLSSFRSQLEADGCNWSEKSLTELPEDTDVVILNAPKQDLTKEEYEKLDAYADQGGHVLLLMPADDGNVRYKNLARFLEPYCMVLDYDRVRETDDTRMTEGDPYRIQGDFITRPNFMPVYSEIEDTGKPILHNARSFYFIVHDLVSRVKQDAMIKSSATVIGEPFGGTEDDPVTYEGTSLNLMGYARDETRNNSAVVFVGANDFLNDENYAIPTSAYMVSLMHSTMGWFGQY